MNKIFYLSFVVFIFLFGCQLKHKNVRKIQIGEFTLEGDIGNDSIYNGPINYYDKSNFLFSKRTFENGVLNGPSISYYKDGAIKDKSEYTSGLKNGFSFSYDSIGRIDYKDYYYYGRQMGPTFYYLSGQIKEYYFLTLKAKAYSLVLMTA